MRMESELRVSTNLQMVLDTKVSFLGRKYREKGNYF